MERSCCVCGHVVDKLPGRVKHKLRAPPTENKAVLKELIFSELNEFDERSSLPGEMLFSLSHEQNVLQKIIERIVYIDTEPYLLDDYKI